MASAVLFGWVGDRWGHQWPLIISGIVMALLPALLAVSRYKLSEVPGPVPERSQA